MLAFFAGVMAGLVPAIHAFAGAFSLTMAEVPPPKTHNLKSRRCVPQNVDGRDKPGHDEGEAG